MADVRLALRQMHKWPGFSTAVILLLGLGIGATTAVFSLVDAILLKPVPYPEPTAARRYWPGEDPVGKQVLVPSQRVRARIVGVVDDIKYSSLREVAGPGMLEPYTQDVWPSMELMHMVLRTRADPIAAIGAARAVIHDLDPGIPLADVSTLSALTQSSMSADRFSMLVVGFFAALALILAAVGIYGVIAYSTGQRAREIAIRIALGAQRRNVFGTVLGQGLRFAGLGILFGILAALGTGRVLAGLLYGVSASDPVTLAGVALLIAVVALAASFLPARRAARTSPMEALRGD